MSSLPDQDSAHTHTSTHSCPPSKVSRLRRVRHGSYSSTGFEPFCFLMCHAALRSACGCEHSRQDSQATIRLSACTRRDMPQTDPKSDSIMGYFQECSLGGKAAISFRGLSARSLSVMGVRLAKAL